MIDLLRQTESDFCLDFFQQNGYTITFKNFRVIKPNGKRYLNE